MAHANQHPHGGLSGQAAQAPRTVLPPLCPPRVSGHTMSFVKATPSPNPMAISKLMSPPEPARFDTFAGAEPAADAGKNDDAGKGDEPACPAAAPLSPPVSPKDKKPASATTPAAAAAAAAAAADTTRDPILYPASSDTLPASSPPRPLFADHNSAAAAVVRNDAVAPATPPRGRMAIADLLVRDQAAQDAQPTLFHQTAPPAGRAAPVETTLYLKAELMRTCMEDRRGWLRKEREQLRKDRMAAAERNRRLQLYTAPATKPSQATEPRVLSPRTTTRLLHLQQEASPPQQQRQQQAPSPRQQAPHQSGHSEHRPLAGLHATLDNNHRVTKRTGHHSAAATRAGGPPARIAPQVRGTPRQTGHGHGHGPSNNEGIVAAAAAPGPEPRVRTAAPNREDKDFAQLPDYCPPLHTLPERTNQLKVEWKGTALDLSRDAHRHLLHRDELGLAASLRLDCATYLTSKRRIFMRRLACARIHKEFRKTDAQQACKIDVNKASKLWTAYDKVGWLRIEHMRRHL